MSCYFSAGPFAIGDCGPKSKVSINTSSISKNITNSIQQASSTIGDTTVTMQNQNVSIIGSCCPSLDISQTATMKKFDTTKFTGNFVSDVAKKMSDSISSSLDQSSTQIIGALGAVNGPSLTAAIKSAVQKVTESNSFKNNMTTKISQALSSQNQNVSIQCSDAVSVPKVDGKCVINQNIVMDLLSNNLVQNLMSEVSKDEQLTQIANEVRQASKSEGKGIDSIISSLTGPMMWVAIGVVALVVLFIPIMIFAFKSKVGKRRYYF